jgi:hypothetical protein
MEEEIQMDGAKGCVGCVLWLALAVSLIGIFAKFVMNHFTGMPIIDRTFWVLTAMFIVSFIAYMKGFYAEWWDIRG